MSTISLAEAKTHLSQLVEQAAGGEDVVITRRGRPVARITSLETPGKRIDVAELRALTSTMSMQSEPSADFIRRMRDEERY